LKRRRGNSSDIPNLRIVITEMYRNSGKGVGSLSDLIRVALMYVHLLLPLAYNNEVNETVVQMYKGRGKLALLCKKVSPV
jgi:hypothetical protein